MTTTITTIIKFLIFTVICLCFISNSPEVYARTADKPCQRAESIFARGSGQGSEDGEYLQFVEQLNKRLEPSYVRANHYELGKEWYGGYQYPAVNVGNAWNALGAITSSGFAHDYGDSVKKGMWELKAYIQERYKKCKSAGSYFILGGYSQGAQVVGQLLPGLSQEIRNRIIYVALFGDPKLYFPEGKQPNWFTPPPACQGKNLSPYRVVIGDCFLSEGRLGARQPYLPTDMLYKTDLWCYADDYVCGTSHYPFASGHGTYGKDGMAIDSAARKAVTLLKIAIEKEPKPISPPATTPGPTPPPPPSSSSLIDTSYKFRHGLNGQDIVFLVDVSPSMAPRLAKIAEAIKAALPGINEKGGRVALMSYIGYPIGAGYGTGVGGFHFGMLSRENVSIHEQLINMILQSSPAYAQGSTLYALNHAMQTLQWQYGAAKSVILITNSSRVTNPDSYGVTLNLVSKTALAIDPVNIYPVVPEEFAGEYSELAELTSGQVTTFTDNIEIAMDDAFEKTQNRPVPFLKNTEYLADIGQEVTFDASDSYVIDAEITKYEWDFDGDSVFEATTTEPVINHTYDNLFDGLMQVRVSASNGTIANMSAVVKIGTYVIPVFASAPEDLRVRVIEIVDNISKIELTWDPVTDENTISLALSMNGIMLGTLPRDRTSIVITDVDRSFDNDFGITGLDSEGRLGHGIYETLPLIETPVTEEAPVNPAGPRTPVSDPSSELSDEPIFTPTEDYDIRQDFGSTEDKVLGASTAASPLSTESSDFTWHWLLSIIAASGLLCALVIVGLLRIRKV